LLRSIDRFVDLSDVRSHVAPFYSCTGRPSIDPELLVRMPLVGYCYGIRSERRLCEEVHLNLAYRWFCRLGLDGEVPDHSTFSKNRHGRFRVSIGAFKFGSDSHPMIFSAELAVLQRGNQRHASRYLNSVVCAEWFGNRERKRFI
jgi:Transposase domain (DUF772)